MSTENAENIRRSIKLWWRSHRRSSQVVIVLALFASITIVAYAASILLNTADASTTLTKDWYVEVALSNSYATGTIRPGGTVSISPVIKNKGDINTIAFIKLSMPTVGGARAYDYEIDSSWIQVD